MTSQIQKIINQIQEITQDLRNMPYYLLMDFFTPLMPFINILINKVKEGNWEDNTTLNIVDLFDNILYELEEEFDGDTYSRLTKLEDILLPLI